MEPMLHPDSDAENPDSLPHPLYKCLADSILAATEQGLFPPGSRLPTVREMASAMSLSQGTVKHAYDVLQQEGFIEKIQGRGTFIRELSSEPAGKKERAMEAIDRLLDEMDTLGFSPRETEIFFHLKLREREESAFVRVTVVDCNPEALGIISHQITAIPGVEVQRFLLEELLRSPYKPAADSDLVITTPNHFAQVEPLVGEDRIFRVALSPSRLTVAQLARASGNGKTGLVTASSRFAAIVSACWESLAGQEPLPRFFLNAREDILPFLAKLDTLILPDGYPTFCSPEIYRSIRRFEEEGGKLIPFSYRIDAGSLMFLEQRIGEILLEKTRGMTS